MPLIEISGTIERDMSKPYRRASFVDGTVSSVMAQPGQLIRRGDPIVSIRSAALDEAQEEFLWTLQYGRARYRGDWHMQMYLDGIPARLPAIGFSKRQIEHITKTRRRMDPVPVLSPTGGILVNVLEAGEDFRIGEGLFEIADRLVVPAILPVVHCRDPGSLAKAFVDIDGKREQFDARVLTVGNESLEGDTRRVVFEILAAPVRAVPGCTATITFEIANPEPQGKLEAYIKRHGREPRGVERLEYGLPWNSPYPTKKPINAEAPAGPELGTPYVPASSRPASHYQAHRSSLTLDRSTWEACAIETVRGLEGSFCRHFDCTANVEELPAPTLDVTLSAPMSGQCTMRPIRPGAFVEAGAVVAEIRGPELTAVQQEYLLSLGKKHAISKHRARLAALGMTDSDVHRLTETKQIFESMPVITRTAGIVQHRPAEDCFPVRTGSMIVSLKAAHTLVLRCELPDEQFEQLPSRVALRVRSAGEAIGTDLYETKAADRLLIDVQPSARLGWTAFGIPVPISATLSAGEAVDVRISDPSTVRKATAVPRDCVVKIENSSEVLIHSGRGELRPVSVLTDAEEGGLVEIVDGLTDGDTLVRHLSRLMASRPDIRAIVGGFWTPTKVTQTKKPPQPTA